MILSVKRVLYPISMALTILSTTSDIISSHDSHICPPISSLSLTPPHHQQHDCYIVITIDS